jgi:hypothetical protein
VKSRLQAGNATALKYKSALDGLLSILKEEGIEGLYKGVSSKLLQSVLTAAILFAGQRRIYEIAKKVSVPKTQRQILTHLLHTGSQPYSSQVVKQNRAADSLIDRGNGARSLSVRLAFLEHFRIVRYLEYTCLDI